MKLKTSKEISDFMIWNWITAPHNNPPTLIEKFKALFKR